MRIDSPSTEQIQMPKRSDENFDAQPFDERDDDEQMELIDSVYHLMYQSDDLKRTTNDARENLQRVMGEEGVGVPVPRRIGSRFIPNRGHARTQNIESNRMATAIQMSDELKYQTRGRLRELLAIPGLREAFKREQKISFVHVKVAHGVEDQRHHADEIREEIAQLRREQTEGVHGATIGFYKQLISSYQKELDEIETNLAELSKHETMGPMVDRYLALRNYQAAWQAGRIIEIPSAKAIIDRVISSMREHQPYLLAGHLGSGKTEIARHAAKMHMVENAHLYLTEAECEKYTDVELYDMFQPEFFSGSDEASIYDLVGKLKLKGKSANDPETISIEAKTLAQQLHEKGIRDIPAEEIVKLLLGQGNVTETIFNYGPLGRALRDNKPLIIDEINLAPPEVIGRINDVLLRRVGDKIRLQENGEEIFTRGEGFEIIGTLNVGGKYAGTKDFNAAFQSRWVGEEVDYPPLAETYDLILTACMRKDAQRLPPGFPMGAYEQLTDLALVVRESQELFTGKTKGQRFMHRAQGMAAQAAQLEKMVISTRDLIKKIIGPWVMCDFSIPLEEIIANKILRSGFNAPDDQKFMTELFLRRGFFSGWTAAKFAQYGITSVSDAEIEILQVSNVKEAFSNADTFATAAKAAHTETAKAARSMLRGNSELVSQLLAA